MRTGSKEYDQDQEAEQDQEGTSKNERGQSRAREGMSKRGRSLRKMIFVLVFFVFEGEKSHL